MTNRLLELLADSSVHVRNDAALALGAQGTKQSIVPLTQGLSDKRTAYACAIALGEVGTTEAVQALITYSALRANASTNGQPAGGIFGALDDPMDVRVGIAIALGTAGSAASVDALLKLVQSPLARVREQAVLALGRVSDSPRSEAVLTLLRDPDLSVRHSALSVLREWRDEMTLAAIVSAVQGNFIEPIEGVEALNEIADDWPHRGAGRSLLQGLLEELETSDMETQILAARTLSIVHSDDVTEALIKTFRSRKLPAIDLPPSMCPHPELGYGCGERFGDRFRCRWAIAQ